MISCSDLMAPCAAFEKPAALWILLEANLSFKVVWSSKSNVGAVEGPACWPVDVARCCGLKRRLCGLCGTCEGFSSGIADVLIREQPDALIKRLKGGCVEVDLEVGHVPRVGRAVALTRRSASATAVTVL